jgi:thioredoxin reductase (NADPH)
MFFRNKVVAVNGGGNTAVEDAAFLANYCAKVYIIHRRDQFRADEAEVERLRKKENVEFVLNSTITKLNRDTNGLTSIEVADKISGETRTLEIAGLFVAIGQAPDNSAFANVANLDEKGYVTAGEDLLTGTPGIFTAGDCRTKSVRQLTTAASDGAVAALAAATYIDALK